MGTLWGRERGGGSGQRDSPRVGAAQKRSVEVGSRSYVFDKFGGPRRPEVTRPGLEGWWLQCAWWLDGLGEATYPKLSLVPFQPQSWPGC